MEPRQMTRASLEAAFRVSLAEALRDRPSEAREVDALVQLCLMGVMPTGQENPRVIMSAIGDELLEHLMSNFAIIQENPVTKPVHQFFLIEWCGRKGHLLEDWRWAWDGRGGGRIMFRSKVPLDQVQRPLPDIQIDPRP